MAFGAHDPQPGGTLPLLAPGAAAALRLREAAQNSLIGWVPRDIEHSMEQPIFHMGTLPITPWFLVKAVVFLVVIGLLARATRYILQKRVLPRTSMEPGHQDALARWAQYLVFTVALIIGLQSSGLNLSSILVVGGALGVGIGFGLQNVANNFISGLILLIERPIRVGDIIELGQTQGRVARIGGRSTWLRTGQNAMMIVPNADLIQTRVTNWTAGGPRVLVDVKVGVGYGSDPEKVRSILLAVAKARPDALADPAPAVLFQGFGDSALNFVMYVWFSGTVFDAGGFRSELNFDVFQALKQNGIEIPFPQRDLHLRSADSAISVRSSG
jgi:small-conductance mechanosensitive channel